MGGSGELHEAAGSGRLRRFASAKAALGRLRLIRTAHPSSLVCLRKQKDQRVRFTASRDDPVNAFGYLGCLQDQRRFLVPISPAEIDTGVLRDSAGRFGMRTAAFMRPHTGALSSPRTRFRSARVPTLLVLFKSGSGTPGISDGQHEAHFARRSGAERFVPRADSDNCLGAALMAAPVSCW
jgi:hypothetical protein